MTSVRHRQRGLVQLFVPDSWGDTVVFTETGNPEDVENENGSFAFSNLHGCDCGFTQAAVVNILLPEEP